MFDRYFFGNTFDFNRDGKMDPFERAVDMAMYDELMRQEAQDASKNADWTENDTFAEAGVDLEAFSWMDPEEKAVALEEAGLDPDDFDLDF